MSGFAQIFCQRCGVLVEEPIVPGRRAMEPCPCGGLRQVVCIGRRRGDPRAGSERLEWSVRQRSEQETATRGRHRDS
jgi:hypothetical protein